MLKGRILPFYALLRMSTEPKGVPEWETYANPRVKKGTAKLIRREFFLQEWGRLVIMVVTVSPYGGAQSEESRGQLYVEKSHAGGSFPAQRLCRLWCGEGGEHDEEHVKPYQPGYGVRV